MRTEYFVRRSSLKIRQLDIIDMPTNHNELGITSFATEIDFHLKAALFGKKLNYIVNFFTKNGNCSLKNKLKSSSSSSPSAPQRNYTVLPQQFVAISRRVANVRARLFRMQL